MKFGLGLTLRVLLLFVVIMGVFHDADQQSLLT